WLAWVVVGALLAHVRGPTALPGRGLPRYPDRELQVIPTPPRAAPTGAGSARGSAAPPAPQTRPPGARHLHAVRSGRGQLRRLRRPLRANAPGAVGAGVRGNHAGSCGHRTAATPVRTMAAAFPTRGNSSAVADAARAPVPCPRSRSSTKR